MFVKNGNCSTVGEVVYLNTGIPNDVFLVAVRDPFIKNLDEAVALAKRYLAANPGGRVIIVGDYDSDGLNATAIMYWCMLKAGADVSVRIPRRISEGYGLSEKIIDGIQGGPGLLITVDNGIAAAGAVRKAKEKGLSVIVIDHHFPPVDEKTGKMALPEADVIIDPHTEDASAFKEYCGAGLAYRFARRMFNNAVFAELLVLASIATVSDVMPLVGANRTLVRDGLFLINKRKVVPGLNVLLDRLGKDGTVTEEDYGFGIGPLFNSPGRIYDRGAEEVVRLLCSKKDNPQMGSMAEKLIDANKKRKEIQKSCMDIASGLSSDGEGPVVLYDPRFHEGIVGLVAGDIARQRHCPAIVFADSSKEGLCKGSGRSIPGVNLKEILDRIQGDMVGYGGHAGAAGITIRKDNLARFANSFRLATGDIPPKPVDIPYDLELNVEKLDELCNELHTFAPFGEGNPKIVFHGVFGIPAEKFRLMGDGSHFMVRLKTITLKAFNLAGKYKLLGNPEKIECVGYLSDSWYRGKRYYEFEIIDFASV